jgi:EAL domain-containing protein (putative c-di-GMP-specific phosphodiesterase class I)
MMRCADTAMYRAKQDGRGQCCFYTSDMQVRSARQMQLEAALRRAEERGELMLHYQPQLDVASQRVIGLEALARWRHPELGMISPAEFIPLAESTGQILGLGAWVMRTAARQMKRWIDEGQPPLVVAVNLSAIQFKDPGLPEMVRSILEEAGLPPECLELELTESVAAGNPQAACAILDRLHALGIRLSIDDFGTGFSSLNHLKRFPIHTLKIDQSFVRDIGTDPDDRAIVQAIIQMAHALRLTTIAEGVETTEQASFLQAHGCDMVQGYRYCRPQEPAQALAWIQQHEAALDGAAIATPPAEPSILAQLA